MAEKDAIITVSGVVTEVLPNAYFRVLLLNGRIITAHTSGRIRKRRVRIISGDNVMLEMTKYDLTKGRIVSRDKK